MITFIIPVIFLSLNFSFIDTTNSITAFTLGKVYEENEAKITDECLSRILREDIIFENGVVVIFSHTNRINRIWVEEQSTIITEVEKDKEIKYNVRKGDILYVFSNLPIPNILEKVSWSSTTKFIVSSRNDSMENIFSAFWERRIVNVIIIKPNFPSNFIHILTYFPYSENHCESLGEIVSLGECNLIVNFFPEKVSNLHGCPLIVTLVERSPAVINNDGVADGVETNILNIIAKSMNATPNFYFLKGRLRFYRSNGNSILLELLENHSHIVAGSLIYTESMYLMSDGIEYPVVMCMTVIVPKVTRPTYRYIFENIIPGKVLAGVLINIALGIFCTYVFLNLLGPRTTLKSAARRIIHSPQMKFYYDTIRVFLALWFLGTFLLHTLFEATVSSSVLAPNDFPQIESLEDVFKNNLLLDGDTFMMKEVLQTRFPGRQRLDICGCTLKKALTFIAEKRDRAFIDTKFNAIYNLMELPEIASKIHIPEKCILTFRPVIQLRKHSPFLQIIRKFMLYLSESGIIEKSFDTYNRKIRQKGIILRENGMPLTLNDFEGSFTLLFIGLTFSILLFLIELFIQIINTRLSSLLPTPY